MRPLVLASLAVALLVALALLVLGTELLVPIVIGAVTLAVLVRMLLGLRDD